jgi:hypothetical protein
MGARGPKSAAEIRAVVVEGQFGHRPEPPDDLTERQIQIWRAVTASESSDFFNSEALRGLLKNYCRHTDSAEGISGIINTFDPQWLKSAEGTKRYAELLRMRDMEVRAAAGMATKLRLTNQSRYTPVAAATQAKAAAKGPRPWEV